MAGVPSSPINVVISEELEEKRPLLSQPESEGSGEDKKERKFTKDNVKKLFILVALWLAYLFISAAYSVIAPFYPIEVQ